MFARNAKMMVAAGTLAMTIGLVGCGGSQAASSAEAASTAEAASSAETTSAAAATSATEAATSAASAADATSTASAADATSAANATSAATSTTSATDATTTTSTTDAAAAPATSTADGYIGDAEALTIAIADTGIPEANIVEKKVELDLDDPTVHYDVDLKATNADGVVYEFDYDIDATTGAIIFSSSEVDD